MRKDQCRKTKAYACYIRPLVEQQRQIIIDIIQEAIKRTVINASEEECQAIQDLVFKPETITTAQES